MLIFRWIPSLFEHQVHQNIIYTSYRRYSIHINKKSSMGLKKLIADQLLQSGIVTIDEVPHAQLKPLTVTNATMLVMVRNSWKLFGQIS